MSHLGWEVWGHVSEWRLIREGASKPRWPLTCYLTLSQSPLLFGLPFSPLREGGKASSSLTSCRPLVTWTGIRESNDLTRDYSGEWFFWSTNMSLFPVAVRGLLNLVKLFEIAFIWFLMVVVLVNSVWKFGNVKCFSVLFTKLRNMTCSDLVNWAKCHM